MNRIADTIGGARITYWLALFVACMAGTIHALGELAWMLA